MQRRIQPARQRDTHPYSRPKHRSSRQSAHKLLQPRTVSASNLAPNHGWERRNQTERRGEFHSGPPRDFEIRTGHSHKTRLLPNPSQSRNKFHFRVSSEISFRARQIKPTSDFYSQFIPVKRTSNIFFQNQCTSSTLLVAS